MKTFLKNLLKAIIIVFSLSFGIVGFLFWVGKANTDDVKMLCAIPVETSIEMVMKKARELGFSEDSQGALGGGLVVFDENQNESIKWSDDSLPEIQNGKIKVGKISLPPFLRNYCELTFQNRKVVSSRIWTLD